MITTRYSTDSGDLILTTSDDGETIFDVDFVDTTPSIEDIISDWEELAGIPFAKSA